MPPASAVCHAGKQPRELASAPDERAGPGEHGGQGGALHRCLGRDFLALVVGCFQAELENMLRAREVLQLAHPEVGEQRVVGQ